jgi:hypothetical protein
MCIALHNFLNDIYLDPRPPRWVNTVGKKPRLVGPFICLVIGVPLGTKPNVIPCSPND